MSTIKNQEVKVSINILGTETCFTYNSFLEEVLYDVEFGVIAIAKKLSRTSEDFYSFPGNDYILNVIKKQKQFQYINEISRVFITIKQV